MEINLETPERLAAIAEFMQQFGVLADRHRAADVQRLASFLDAYREHFSQPGRPRRFNLLDVTRVGSDEVKHSSIVAWLLTPHGSHGCGPRFLESFLQAADVDVTSADLTGCHVRTELCGAESRIDIAVYKQGRFLVYIENKTFAAEGDEQIDREYRDMLRFGRVLRVPPSKMFPVFLTPSGRLPVSGDPSRWYPVSYAQVARGWKTLERELPEKTGLFITDLIEQYDRWSS